MTYYRAIIVTVIWIIVLLAGAALDKRKGKLSGWTFVLMAMSALAMFFSFRSSRDIDDMKLYNKIYSSSEIEVNDDKGSRTVGRPDTEDLHYYSHCGDRPVKAKAKDIREIAELTFVSKPWDSRVTLSLCRITTGTERYPKDAVVNYRGSNYCFLSTKFLYQRAFLYLEEDYVLQLLEKILE